MSLTRAELFEGLVEHGLWLPSPVPGIPGRSAVFESVALAIDATLTAQFAEAGATRVAFPPVIDRDLIRRTGYMDAFPELLGSVHAWREERGPHDSLVDCVEAGEPWDGFLSSQPVTLCPAACYPLYPTQSGTLPEGGRLFDLTSWIYRAEPSDDPLRLQAFRQHECVRLGTPESVRTWRDAASEGAVRWLERLGLSPRRVVATDPFFGRGGRLLRANQRAAALKFEVVVSVTSEGEPTAIASFNVHEDKFGAAFEIVTADGAQAHTACLGFGLERVALALFAQHGFVPDAWPADVRAALGLPGVAAEALR